MLVPLYSQMAIGGVVVMPNHVSTIGINAAIKVTGKRERMSMESDQLTGASLPVDGQCYLSKGRNCFYLIFR